MKNEKREIKVNGVDVTVYSDGSIEKPFYRRTKRTFGYSHGNGYRVVDIGGKMFLVHRIVAMAFLDDYSEDLQVDHVSGDKADNCPPNLRMVTSQGNQRAFRRPTRGASSQYRGVYWFKQRRKWVARVKVNGKGKFLGYFDSEEGAALAWNIAALKYGFADEALNDVSAS